MEFITDRTYADVQIAKQYENANWQELDEEEQEEWLAGLKGSLNYTTLNRIEQNTYLLESMLMVSSNNQIEWQNTGTNYGVSGITQDTVLILLDNSVSATIVTSRGEITSITTIGRTEITYTGVSYSVYINLGGDISKAFLVSSINPVLTNIKTNWTMSDYPLQSELQRIIDNINYMINYYGVYSVPLINVDFSKFDFMSLNQIEQIQKDISEYIQGAENEVTIPWTTEYIIDDNGNVIEDNTEEHILMTDYLRTGTYDIYVEAPKNTIIKAYFYIYTQGYYYEKAEEFISDGNRITISKAIYNYVKIYANTDNKNDVRVYVK